VDFNNRKSFRIPLLRNTTPVEPNNNDSTAVKLPILTNLDFQILLVAKIINISVIDFNELRKK